MNTAEAIEKAKEQGNVELVIDDQDITTLPEMLWGMTNLESLEIVNCINLEEISGKIANLVNLRSFKIARSRIKTFPLEFWQLSGLTSLEIVVCPQLVTIPPEIGLLSNLTALKITGFEYLVSLPDEILNLNHLTSLRITKCVKLKLPSEIDRLPNLTLLEIEDNCSILESHFPEDIPIDSHARVLRVISPSGEIKALFFGADLLKEVGKFASLDDFCESYDQLYDDYQKWNQAGLNPNCTTPDEQEEDYRQVVESLKWNTYIMMRIKVKGYDFLLQKLTRLAYPYACDLKRTQQELDQLKGENSDISDHLYDLKVLRKAFGFGLVETFDLIQEISTTGWRDDPYVVWFERLYRPGFY